MRTGLAEDSEDYLKSYPLLIANVTQMEEHAKGSLNSRNTVDLKYMILTYIEKGTFGAMLMQKKDYEGAIKAFDETKEIASLITRQYNKLYKAILIETKSRSDQAFAYKKTMKYINLTLLFIGIAISVILIKFIATAITKPIERLYHAATEFSLFGDDATVFYNIQVDTKDEIGALAEAFRRMGEKINQQVLEITEKAELEKKLGEEEVKNLRTQKLLKESELKALQSRINPHFMFNSLNLIAKMAYMENAEQTASLMESLGDLLRYNLDNFSKTVTLDDETGNIKDYYLIQNKRFGERIKFEMETDEEVSDAMMPCLIIQPLVENAIIHGVGMYVKNGIVGVSIKRKENQVFIKVYDNGVGIDEETLTAIGALIETKDMGIGENHIGLSNVFERLKLFFDNEVHISVKSEPGILTEFMMVIPYRKKKVIQN